MAVPCSNDLISIFNMQIFRHLNCHKITFVELSQKLTLAQFARNCIIYAQRDKFDEQDCYFFKSEVNENTVRVINNSVHPTKF